SKVVLVALAVGILLVGHVLALSLARHAFVDLPFAWGLLRAIPLFVMGSLIERLTSGWRIGWVTYFAALAGAFAGVIALSCLPRHAVTDSAVLVLLGVVLAVSGAVTFKETVVTQRMGRASFALFLTHSLVGAVWFGAMPKLVDRFGLGTPAQWGLWALGAVAAIVTAFVFDALVDKPLSERVSRLGFVKGGV
ncbi:MAG: acyltransferase, partial [Asticcacaulis sp.]|nr:acyltransferase [Asticcacaulis sp.]